MNKKLLLLATALLLFTTLAITVKLSLTDPINAQAAVIIVAHRTPAQITCAKIISAIGEWYTYIPIALILLALPKTRIKSGIPAAVTLATSAALNQIIKRLLAIPRPALEHLSHANGYGFPSGHVMNGTAYGLILLYLLYKSNAPRVVKLSFTALGIAFILSLSCARITLSVHSLTDVIGGYLMGIAVFTAGAMLADHTARRVHSTERKDK